MPPPKKIRPQSERNFSCRIDALHQQQERLKTDIEKIKEDTVQIEMLLLRKHGEQREEERLRQAQGVENDTKMRGGLQEDDGAAAHDASRKSLSSAHRPSLGSRRSSSRRDSIKPDLDTGLLDPSVRRMRRSSSQNSMPGRHLSFHTAVLSRTMEEQVGRTGAVESAKLASILRVRGGSAESPDRWRDVGMIESVQ